MRKVIVAGTRGCASWEYKRLLERELLALNDKRPIDEIIHGACPNSADMLCEDIIFGAKVTGVPADWESYGKKAGFIRNSRMAETPEVTDLVCVWDGKSNGTKNMIQEAVKNGIYVTIIPATLEP
jgi:hypothetical protein